MVTAPMFIMKTSGGPEEPDDFNHLQCLTLKSFKNEKHKNVRLDIHTDTDLI